MVERDENDGPREGLPSLPGTYALVLRLSRRVEFLVGKLGVLKAQPGFYVYIGSALGPGGLAARVGRHCRGEKRLRWHIDYLRAVAQINEVWYATGKNHRECQWASGLRSLPGASVPVPGFGASDCACPAHLVYFKMPPSPADFRKRLGGQRITRLPLAGTQGAKIAVAESAQRLRTGGTRR